MNPACSVRLCGLPSTTKSISCSSSLATFSNVLALMPALYATASFLAFGAPQRRNSSAEEWMLSQIVCRHLQRSCLIWLRRTTSMPCLRRYRSRGRGGVDPERAAADAGRYSTSTTVSPRLRLTVERGDREPRQAQMSNRVNRPCPTMLLMGTSMTAVLPASKAYAMRRRNPRSGTSSST